MTTTASGLLCWRDFHPLERQLASLQLLDDLVSEGEQRVWHGEAERLGGLEIDGKFDLRNLLQRQIGGFFTFQNTPCIRADLMESVYIVRSV